MTSSNFFAQIMAPGGGIILIPFTRGVILCLFLLTVTVFIWGVARVNMAILGFLSLGMYIALGVFQTEYKKVMGGSSSSNNNNAVEGETSTTSTTKRRRPAVTSSKRED
mmetsp:Transcript_11656/g.13704  ORF Transcript_11656/g.13704 Transcript_11656/m.13704 type:complete len:109 (+) Transcript_11656:130-456(+)